MDGDKNYHGLIYDSEFNSEDHELEYMSEYEIEYILQNRSYNEIDLENIPLSKRTKHKSISFEDFKDITYSDYFVDVKYYNKETNYIYSILYNFNYIALDMVKNINNKDICILSYIYHYGNALNVAKGMGMI